MDPKFEYSDYYPSSDATLAMWDTPDEEALEEVPVSEEIEAYSRGERIEIAKKFIYSVDPGKYENIFYTDTDGRRWLGYKIFEAMVAGTPDGIRFIRQFLNTNLVHF